LKENLDAGGYGVQIAEEVSYICQHSTTLNTPHNPIFPLQDLLHTEQHPSLTSLQLKMPNALNAEMLDLFQHVTELNPKSQNYSKICRLCKLTDKNYTM
jgi:hypothetical protein